MCKTILYSTLYISCNMCFVYVTLFDFYVHLRGPPKSQEHPEYSTGKPMPEILTLDALLFVDMSI